MNGNNIRVLLLEDNAGDARLLQEILQEVTTISFHIVWADSLAKACQYLAHDKFDIAIVDLALPDAIDLDTVIQTNQLSPDLPIVVLTGSAGDEKGLRALRAGAQDYLTKGRVDPELLVRTIRYAIERKRLETQLAHYTGELRARNDQIQNDLLLAREVQMALLPQHLPTFPAGSSHETSALRFQHYYQPASYLAGDFFNIFPISDTAAGIFICDVMGHGVRAALITAMIRPLVDELATKATDPSQLLSSINQEIFAILNQAKTTIYATAFYLVADLATRQLRYVTAGHPSPIHLSQSRNTVAPLPVNHHPGAALGLFADSTYDTFRQPIDTGDVVLLYTDGLTEALNPLDEQYGEERLLQTIQASAKLPHPDIFSAVLQDIQKFTNGKEFTDDLCLLSMEVKR